MNTTLKRRWIVLARAVGHKPPAAAVLLTRREPGGLVTCLAAILMQVLVGTSLRAGNSSSRTGPLRPAKGEHPAIHRCVSRGGESSAASHRALDRRDLPRRAPCAPACLMRDVPGGRTLH